MYKRIFNKLLIGLVIIFVLFITFTASTIHSLKPYQKKKYIVKQR